MEELSDRATQEKTLLHSPPYHKNTPLSTSCMYTNEYMALQHESAFLHML